MKTRPQTPGNPSLDDTNSAGTKISRTAALAYPRRYLVLLFPIFVFVSILLVGECKSIGGAYGVGNFI